AALAHRLEGTLATARERAPAALADPLLDPGPLVVTRAGEQLLPRPAGTARDPATSGERAYWDLVGGAVPPGEGPWRERALLLGALRRAFARDDVAAISAGARALLRHLAHYRLRAERDLASLLAFTDRFVAEGRPSPELLAALLRDGLSLDDGARIASLQRALAAARSRLAPGDFAWLAERVSELSARAGVAHADFDAAVARPAAPPLALPAPPACPPTPIVTPSGLLLVADGEGLLGVAVDLPELAAALTAEIRAGSLLRPDEALWVAAPTAPTPLDGLAVEVHSTRWVSAAAAAERQFGYKTALVAGAGLLGALLAALAVLLQLKKARFLALRAHFVSAVSHELRTPLASICLLAETLERRLAGRPEARDYPARIVRDAHGLGLLVDNILSFNRLERGQWRPRRSAIGAADLLDAVASDARAHARRPVAITVAAPAELTLDADPELARLLLANLVRNAINYGVREPVRVALAAAATSGGVALTVADDGPGIAPSDQRRVFREFQRGAAARGTRGSGLGLAICHRIAALHGGRLRLVSSSKLGTMFEVTVPATSHRTRPRRAA
ncbi:MAG: two-component sensor histidine kinase, partial [Deltaproteobacteria bacterium HGW-Deltaproteobacteria-14]